MEKENLDKERSLADSDLDQENGAALGGTKNSAALFGDLDEIRRHLDSFQRKPASEQLSAAKTSGEALASCYRCVSMSCQTPIHSYDVTIRIVRANWSVTMNCWREVNNFKLAVAQIEQVSSNDIIPF